MPIKNYRTHVAADKTLGDIQRILAKARASSMSIDYEHGKASAVRFAITVNEKELWFRLPCNPAGVQAALKRDRQNVTLDRARDVAWRIVKDWLDAQMAIVDAGQARMAEVFLPYLLQPGGETLYQKFENQQLKLRD
jgi:hypothetical protein